MKAMRSLRLRLFSFLLALAAVVAAVVGSATYASVRTEADELFDYQLRQMALSLRDQGRIADDERSALANAEFDYVVQVWSIDGVQLYSSLPGRQTALLPARAVLGFSNVEVDGHTWRVFGAATPLRVVQVGQPLAVRRRLAAEAAGRSVLPVLVAAPAVALAMWWLVGLSLAPLARVAEAARRRGAAALDPLPTAALPSEMQPLVDAFNALLGRLSAAFDAERAFIADAAHELRTPLTALRLQIGLVRDAPDAPAREAALARLRAGVERAVHLVEQLLALARAEPGAGAAQATIDLALVARQALADAEPLAAAQGAQIRLDAPEALPMQGDAAALRSLLRNLVDNALKHGRRDGEAGARVALALRSAAEGAVLEVDDAGPGIAAAEREHAFERFRRGDTSRSEGSGLGLAIVQAVARQHGGSVELGSSAEGGLRVTVRLPRR
ncbi:MAG TPA: ATP-binding protein [Rubrivivax sp.]|nr:ATP-binding protein [Rubrivivax sp.]HPP81948.1 ATP-binding protein [Rubrivivax sp.]